jgi:peptidoglycan/xylan/chitin deacetylase (PgdA/CDA1 family)
MHRFERPSVRGFRGAAGLRAGVLGLALLVPLITAGDLHDLPPPIGVRVLGQQEWLPRDITLGRVIIQFGLHPRSGNLLDVQGEVLRADAFPGRVLRNGEAAGGRSSLQDGDRITIRNEHDRTEPTIREVVPVASGVTSNPQFYLESGTGKQVIVKGKISGKVKSSTFVAIGEVETPQAVALTFDDGPSLVGDTTRILAILKRFNVRATFFTVGTDVNYQPDILRAEVAAGMVIGNHTLTHPEPFGDLSHGELMHQMRGQSRLIRKITGETPRLFRPPGGAYSDEIIGVAKKLGMRVVLWSVDPEDWRPGVTAADITSNVLGNVRAGSIVILHDGGGYQDQTIAALPGIIRGIRAMGLDLLPVTP